jgi:hypothetical protein
VSEAPEAFSHGALCTLTDACSATGIKMSSAYQGQVKIHCRHARNTEPESVMPGSLLFLKGSYVGKTPATQEAC